MIATFTLKPFSPGNPGEPTPPEQIHISALQWSYVVGAVDGVGSMIYLVGDESPVCVVEPPDQVIARLGRAMVPPVPLQVQSRTTYHPS